MVWKLDRALYGLKKARRKWFLEVDAFLKQYGLVLMREDQCIYMHESPSMTLIVLLYVDDILIDYDDQAVLQGLMGPMHDKYSVKNLGEARWFLGMRITCNLNEEVTRIDQEQFAREVAHRLVVEDYRSSITPMDQGLILVGDDTEQDLTPSIPFSQTVGGLMYLSRVTRLDIAYAVNRVAA